jgi:phosphoglycerate dehydrogenase-like enzyme
VIAAMKPTAWLVNIARGPIVDETALLEALRQRRIGGAAIDAWWEEPLPPGRPWWDLDNVIVTAHRSNSSPRLRERTLALFGENLQRFRRGEPLLNVVEKRLGTSRAGVCGGRALARESEEPALARRLGRCDPAT